MGTVRRENVAALIYFYFIGFCANKLASSGVNVDVHEVGRHRAVKWRREMKPVGATVFTMPLVTAFASKLAPTGFFLTGWYCGAGLFYEDLAVPVWTSLPSSHSFSANVAEEANFAEGRIR
ncbi:MULTISPECIES: hypothetical protein [unclassified Pseudomonas]|uniref:hypothetical protein n=1 Tax=unclassified Pseudomonas TaxID=196821 RepID=UPI0030D7B5AF